MILFRLFLFVFLFVFNTTLVAQSLSTEAKTLFDKGLISFENSGKLILSKQFDQTVLDKWSINKSINVGSFRPEQIQFLNYHRDVVLN